MKKTSFGKKLYVCRELLKQLGSRQLQAVKGGGKLAEGQSTSRPESGTERNTSHGGRGPGSYG